MKQTPIAVLFVFLCFYLQKTEAQTITSPNIIEVDEDDRVATIFWNSKTYVYDFQYDPDKQDGIYSYRIEWGPVSEGFIHTSITPYRAHMCQALVPGIMYQARVFSLDINGNQSAPSTPITFQHDGTKVDDMRTRLNGFF